MRAYEDRTVTLRLQSETDADEVSISEQNGLQSFSETFHLKKEQPAVSKKQSWWKRIFHRRRLPETEHVGQPLADLHYGPRPASSALFSLRTDEI